MLEPQNDEERIALELLNRHAERLGHSRLDHFASETHRETALATVADARELLSRERELMAKSEPEGGDRK